MIDCMASVGDWQGVGNPLQPSRHCHTWPEDPWQQEHGKYDGQGNLDNLVPVNYEEMQRNYIRGRLPRFTVQRYGHTPDHAAQALEKQ